MINELQGLLLTVFFLGYFADVFFFPSALSYASDIRLLILSLLWLLICKLAHFSSIATFKVTLLFLILLSILFIFFREHASVERVASWVYIFLAIGIVQQFIESRKKSKESPPENA